jgi:hypothetical protein
MSTSRFKLSYRGSLFWLIFWLIFFFPIAFILVLTASSFTVNRTIYNVEYDGSRFWLCFWMILFFPIAFVLLFVNGFSASAEAMDGPVEIEGVGK